MKNPFEKYRGRTVLITGGLGFIGSSLAHRLAEIDNVDITLIDSMSEGLGGNLHNIREIQNKVKVVVASIGDSDIIDRLVGGVDYIFNIAGSVSHIDSVNSPLIDLELNCASHLAFLESCRKFNPQVKVVFTSTRQVYGKPAYLPLDEKHRTHPVDVNGIHKRAAEVYHQIYQNLYGLRTVSLRLTNTYGPRQQIRHNRQGFIAWFLRQALDGGTIELYGDGKQKRDLNYIDDVVDALLLAGLSEDVGGGTFNLGHHQIVSLAEIARLLIELTGKGTTRGVPFPTARQMIDVGNCYCSYQKIEDVLGWRPKINLAEGLRRTVEFYRHNREFYLNANEYSLSKFTPPIRRVK